MARKLSPAMQQTLRIMAEGSDPEIWSDSGTRCHWVYTAPPNLSVRLHASTAWALIRRGLIMELPKRKVDWRPYSLARYALTEAGRRAEEELADA